jgi:peptidyl-prolyl cis-trans isomerase B (cyclophilin B)
MNKKITAFIAALAMLSAAVTGCGPAGTTTTSNNDPAQTEAVTEAEETEAAPAEATEPVVTEALEPVVADVTDRRDFVITLYPEHAPITCENFEKLVNDGFYNGLTFHRIVDGFMAQGGDPNGNGTGGSKDTIKGEFTSNGVDNKLSHTRGVISMARSLDPDSASSQFFICYTDSCKQLDGDYAAFGEVTDGMEVIDAFLAVPRDYNSMGEIAVPMTPVQIVKAEIIDPDEKGNPRVKFTMNEFVISSGKVSVTEDAEAEVTEAEGTSADEETAETELITESEEAAETESDASEE